MKNQFLSIALILTTASFVVIHALNDETALGAEKKNREEAQLQKLEKVKTGEPQEEENNKQPCVQIL